MLVLAGMSAGSLVDTGRAAAAPPAPNQNLTLKLPYKDDFSKRGMWSETTNENYSSAYTPQGYLLSIKKANSALATYLNDFTLGDVVIDMDVSTKGAGSGGEVGILCRVQDSTAGPGPHYYAFVVGDGYYSIFRVAGDQYVHLGEFQQPNGFKPTAANHVRAECLSNWLILTVNGRELAMVQDPDSSYKQGAVGLYTGSDQAGFQEIVKDFTVDDGSQRAVAPPMPLPAEAALSRVLFQDDFSKPDSGWKRLNQDNAVTDYADGGYRMFLNQDSVHAVRLMPGHTFGDVVIQADVVKSAGSDGTNEVGLVCRA